MTEHVASVINRHVCNDEGMTPFEAIHGQRFRGKAAEFGEKVFYVVPKRLRATLDLRWRVGIFRGNSQTSNEAFIGAVNGDVVKSRSIVRVVKPSRWDKAAVLNVRGTPMNMRSQSSDDPARLEELPDPHANADSIAGEGDSADPVAIDKSDVPSLDKQIRITMSDIKKYGFTDGCPTCTGLKDNG